MTSMATTVPAPLSVAPVPEAQRIQVAADHDDFILQLGIGAGNFSDGVEAVLVIAGELGVHVHLDGDRHIAPSSSRINAAVILDRHNHDGYVTVLG